MLNIALNKLDNLILKQQWLNKICYVVGKMTERKAKESNGFKHIYGSDTGTSYKLAQYIHDNKLDNQYKLIITGNKRKLDLINYFKIKQIQYYEIINYKTISNINGIKY